MHPRNHLARMNLSHDKRLYVWLQVCGVPTCSTCMTSTSLTSARSIRMSMASCRSSVTWGRLTNATSTTVSAPTRNNRMVSSVSHGRYHGPPYGRNLFSFCIFISVLLCVSTTTYVSRFVFCFHRVCFIKLFVYLVTW